VQEIKAVAYISDTANDNIYAFDNKPSTYYSSSKTNCYIGIDAGEHKLVNVRRVRYFPYYGWTIAASYIKGAII